MAKEDELELDTGSKKSGGKGKLIIIIVLVVLLTSGAVIGVLFFTGNLGGAGKSASDADSADGSDEHKELVVKEAFYYDLKPAFVVNFEDQTHAAYLQVEMQAMTHDKRVMDQLTKHMPVIRNNIILVLSAQKFEDVKTRQGKEALQASVLQAVQSIIGEAMKAELEKDGEGEKKPENVPNVEQIYFTSLIMQ